MMEKIYVVEDEENIREIESISLRNSGYQVESFENARSFYQRLEEKAPDLVLLDIMLPDINGYEILRYLKSKNTTSSIPVIMVSAKTEEFDLVKGLDFGADDYIKKPFSIIEMISRVKAVLRRSQNHTDEVLSYQNIILNQKTHKCFVNDEEIELTYMEYQLLKYLLINQNIVVSRQQIMRMVWEAEYDIESRTVDMHIKTLRQKLKDGSQYIKTIRNVGYVLE